MKIGTGLPGHSDQFREAADPHRAGENLMLAIHAASSAILHLMEDRKYLKEIKKEFDQYDQ